MLKHLETETRTWTTMVAAQGTGAVIERTAEGTEPMKMPDL